MDVTFLLITLVAAFACLVVHEVGHAVMAKRKGIAIKEIVLGVPKTRLSFRSKYFKCPVTIGIFPFYGYVMTGQPLLKGSSGFTSVCLAGPQASLAWAWLASGAQYLLFYGASPAYLALGAALSGLGILLLAAPEKTVPYLQYAMPATLAGICVFMTLDAFAAVQKPMFSPSLWRSALESFGFIGYITAIFNLMPILPSTDGSQALRHGGRLEMTRHVRYMTHCVVGAFVACLAALIVSRVL